MVDMMLGGIEKWLLNLCIDAGAEMVAWTNVIVSGFWDFGMIQSLLSWIVKIMLAILACSVIVLVGDVLDEMAGGKTIHWPEVFISFLKGLAFILMVPIIAEYSMRFAWALIDAVGMGPGATEFGETYRSIAMGTRALSFIISILIIVMMLIGIFKFFFSAIGANARQVVTMLTAVFYVPQIVRGDTTGIGDWLRPTIAVAGTYFIQYLTFVMGISLISDFDDVTIVNGNFFAGIGFWLVMPQVPRLLNKFGQSSGSKGLQGAIGMASQVRMLIGGR